ncbi:MAG: endonuclease domain-containing protein [Flavobacteriales bacterium]|nr:endonuclease domain-containing protein [Flavobacteriales bacterium]
MNYQTRIDFGSQPLHPFYQKAMPIAVKKEGGKKIISNYLKNNQIMGYNFSKNEKLGKHRVDFYCEALKLSIDIKRTNNNPFDLKESLKDKNLKLKGIKRISFNATEIEQSFENVLFTLVTHVNKRVKQ